MPQLGERLIDHRATPDDRKLLIDEKANAHQLHPMGLNRDDLLVLIGSYRLTLHTEHAGDVRSVHVGIEQSDPRAAVGDPRREVRRDRALADPAFPGGDRDHDRFVVISRGVVVDSDRQRWLVARRRDSLSNRRRQLGFGRRVRRAERQRDVCGFILDRDLADQPCRNDVVGGFGIGLLAWNCGNRNLLERVRDRLAHNGSSVVAGSSSHSARVAGSSLPAVSRRMLSRSHSVPLRSVTNCLRPSLAAV